MVSVVLFLLGAVAVLNDIQEHQHAPVGNLYCMLMCLYTAIFLSGWHFYDLKYYKKENEEREAKQNKGQVETIVKIPKISSNQGNESQVETTVKTPENSSNQKNESQVETTVKIPEISSNQQNESQVETTVKLPEISSNQEIKSQVEIAVKLSENSLNQQNIRQVKTTVKIPEVSEDKNETKVKVQKKTKSGYQQLIDIILITQKSLGHSARSNSVREELSLLNQNLKQLKREGKLPSDIVLNQMEEILIKYQNLISVCQYEEQQDSLNKRITASLHQSNEAMTTLLKQVYDMKMIDLSADLEALSMKLGQDGLLGSDFDRLREGNHRINESEQ